MAHPSVIYLPRLRLWKIYHTYTQNGVDGREGTSENMDGGAIEDEGTKTIGEQRLTSKSHWSDNETGMVSMGKMINNGPGATAGDATGPTLLGWGRHVRSLVSPDVFQRVEFLEHLVALDFFGHVYGHYADERLNDQNNNNSGMLGVLRR